MERMNYDLERKNDAQKEKRDANRLMAYMNAMRKEKGGK